MTAEWPPPGSPGWPDSQWLSSPGVASEVLDPDEAGLAVGSPPRLEVDPPGPQRRATVAFRALLALPVGFAVGLVGIGAGVVQVLGWFAALVLGRLPGWVWRFEAGYLRLLARVSGYFMLLTDQYPDAGLEPVLDYPVRLIFAPPGRLNRAAVFFRVLLAVPAWLIANLVAGGWFVASFVAWVWILITGRTPRAYFLATTAALRWYLQFQAWMSMVTSGYPRQLYGERGARPSPEVDATSMGRLRLTEAADILLSVYIVLGGFYLAWSGHSDIVQFEGVMAGMDQGTVAAQATPFGVGAKLLPSPAQQALLNRIPASLRAGCFPTDNPTPALSKGLTAVEWCSISDTGGVDRVYYYQYDSPASTSGAFRAMVDGWGWGDPDTGPAAGTTGNCDQGMPGLGTWQSTPSTPSDPTDGEYLACGTGPKGAYLEWTSAASNIRAELDPAPRGPGSPS